MTDKFDKMEQQYYAVERVDLSSLGEFIRRILSLTLDSDSGIVSIVGANQLEIPEVVLSRFKKEVARAEISNPSNVTYNQYGGETIPPNVWKEIMEKIGHGPGYKFYGKHKKPITFLAADGNIYIIDPTAIPSPPVWDPISIIIEVYKATDISRKLQQLVSSPEIGEYFEKLKKLIGWGKPMNVSEFAEYILHNKSPPSNIDSHGCCILGDTMKAVPSPVGMRRIHVLANEFMSYRANEGYKWVPIPGHPVFELDLKLTKS